MNNCMKKFIKKFKPSENLQKSDEETLNFFKKILPKEIINLWEEYDFGDIFHYRRLKDNNDISILDIHYRKIAVCSYSYQEFFEEYIVDKKVIKNVLRVDLYKKAVKKIRQTQ